MIWLIVCGWWRMLWMLINCSSGKPGKKWRHNLKGFRINQHSHRKWRAGHERHKEEERPCNFLIQYNLMQEIEQEKFLIYWLTIKLSSQPVTTHHILKEFQNFSSSSLKMLVPLLHFLFSQILGNWSPRCFILDYFFHYSGWLYVLGYNARCKQKYVFYYHVHKMLK